MTAKDALATHLRDELGHHPHSKARPVQASIASAVAFTIGGLIPFIGALTLGASVSSTSAETLGILAFTVAGLIIAGAVGAKTAGSRLLIPTLRVLIGGCIAMAVTAGIGQLFNASVG